MTETSKLIIPSDPERLVEVDAFAEARIARLNFTADQRDDIAISLSEAVNNAIEHGNKHDAEKKVFIKLIEEREGLRIEVMDQGRGFDPEEVKDPTDPENLLAESGRGLLIVRHMMDEVNVEPSAEGTRIVMFKRYAENSG